MQRLLPHLTGALRAETWQEREAHLVPAYETMAERHNALGLTPPLDSSARGPFYDRPFQVLRAERFVAATAATISDPTVRAIIDRAGLIGGIDQISDNVDFKRNPASRVRPRAVYDGGVGDGWRVTGDGGIG